MIEDCRLESYECRTKAMAKYKRYRNKVEALLDKMEVAVSDKADKLKDKSDSSQPCKSFDII